MSYRQEGSRPSRTSADYWEQPGGSRLYNASLSSDYPRARDDRATRPPQQHYGTNALLPQSAPIPAPRQPRAYDVEHSYNARGVVGNVELNNAPRAYARDHDTTLGHKHAQRTEVRSPPTREPYNRHHSSLNFPPPKHQATHPPQRPAYRSVAGQQQQEDWSTRAQPSQQSPQRRSANNFDQHRPQSNHDLASRMPANRAIERQSIQASADSVVSNSFSFPPPRHGGQSFPASHSHRQQTARPTAPVTGRILSLMPGAPLTGSAVAGGTSASGQTKRDKWGPPMERDNSPLHDSWCDDSSGELGDNSDRFSLGFGAAPGRDSRPYKLATYASLKRQKQELKLKSNGRGAISCPVNSLTADNTMSMLQERNRKRFGNGHAPGGGGVCLGAQPGGYTAGKVDSFDIDTMVPIVGTCLVLDKPYFRLTAAPDPCLVRPESVLKIACARLQMRLTVGTITFVEAFDQLMGMRQDLTVQQIRTVLAVLIYEMSGRLSLEYGEFAEFNQCQTQLLTILYPCLESGGCRGEFHAYRLLYGSVQSLEGSLDMAQSLQATTPELAAMPIVAHALQVRKAIAMLDYPAFFYLYNTATKLVPAFMDVAARKLRWGGLCTCVKTCHENLPVVMIARMLGFVRASSKDPSAQLAAAPAAACMTPFPDRTQDDPMQGSASAVSVAGGLHGSEIRDVIDAVPTVGNVHINEVGTDARASLAPNRLHDSDESAEAGSASRSKHLPDCETASWAAVSNSIHDSATQQVSPLDLTRYGENDATDCADWLLPGCMHARFVGRHAAADSEEEAMATCMQWLTAHGAVIFIDPCAWACWASSLAPPKMLQNSAGWRLSDTTNATPANMLVNQLSLSGVQASADDLQPMVDVKASAGQLKQPAKATVSRAQESLSFNDFMTRSSKVPGAL